MIKMVNEKSQFNALDIYRVFFYIKKSKKTLVSLRRGKRKRERILGVHNLDLSGKTHKQSIKGYDEKTRRKAKIVPWLYRKIMFLQ